MNVLAICLAVVGLALLILLALGALSDEVLAPPPPTDAATPYREGLHAAVRMQRVAQDLEQQIYAEAARHIDTETKPASTRVRGQT
jgi:hypothetical protein